MPATKGISLIQQKMLSWMREHHPTDWVDVNGTNLQVARGLQRMGFVEIRVKPRLERQMRLCVEQPQEGKGS